MSETSLKEQVFGLLEKNSILQPTHICKILKLDYAKHGQYVSNLKTEFKSHMKSGQGPNRPVFHHVRGFVYVPRNVDRVVAGTQGWCVSRSRNHMLVWRDRLGRVEWFESGRANFWVRKPASKGKMCQLLCNAFSYTDLITDVRVLESFLGSARLKGAHAVWPTGERLPYVVIDLFKASNGVKVKLGDLSHPDAVEVEYCLPDWAERTERILAQNAEALKHSSEVISQLLGGQAGKPDKLIGVV